MSRTLRIAAMTLALASSFASAQNIVVNGDFEAGKPPWVFFTDNVDNEFEVVNGIAEIQVRETANTQLYQAPLMLRGNTEYELSFFAARTEAPQKRLQSFRDLSGTDGHPVAVGTSKLLPDGGMIVAISQHGPPYENYCLLRQVNLNDTLRQFVYRFTTGPGDKSDARLRFAFYVQQGIYDFSLDNVVLRALNCGNGLLDPGESCDDGNTRPGDGCDATCSEECQVNYGQVDTDAWTLALWGRALCTADGIGSADPDVFFGSPSGNLVQVPLLDNGETFIVADLSGVAPLEQATHKVIVICPGGGKEIDVSVGTSVQTVTARTTCSAATQCSVTATCPAGEVLAGSWSFDGDLGAVQGGVATGYTANGFTVTLQGPAGFAGATLEAQVRCAP